MKKLFVFAMAFFVLLSGCSDQLKSKEQLVADGIKLIQEKKDPRGAIILFKNALDKDQNYIDARFQLAKAYYSIGKLDAAENELQKVRRQNPSSADVKIESARVMAYSNRADDALKQLAEFLSDDSTNCDALHIAGWAHAVKKDFPGAVTLLNKAVSVCGEQPEPTLTLATVNMFAGSIQEAESQIQTVLGKEPENRRALYLLANIQQGKRDIPAALQTLDRIIQATPNDIEAKYRKGLLYVESGEYDKGLAVAQELIQKSSKRPEGYRLQGFVQFYKKQYNDAIGSLQKALLIQPNAGAHYVLGIAFYSRNEIEQAISQFQKALDLQPAFARARLHLAMAFLSKKRLDDAVREAKTVLAQDEDNAVAHNVLGSAYLAQGNNAEGISELNRALAIDPSLTDVHIKKGLLAMKKGQGQEAESELAAAVKLKPEAQDTRRILALYYLNHDEFAKASDTLKKGIQGGASDAVTYFLLGEICLRQNKLNEARTYYEKAKESDPKYDLAYVRLASIAFTQEKPGESLQELRSLVEHSSSKVQALLLLASFAEMNGNEAEALKAYLQAADTKKTEGIIAASRYLQRTDNGEKAVKLLNDALGVASADRALQETKGQILFANKKYKEALAVFESVERASPQAGFGYIVNTYLAMGEHAKALEKVRAEIKKEPTNPAMRAELSRIYLRMGKKSDAVENAREIIRKNPESNAGYLALAQVYQSGGETDKAIEVLKSAARGKDAGLAFMLGNLYAGRKNYPAALEQYRKAENIRAGSEQVIFQKGAVLYAMGRKKEAAEEYQKVLRLSPNHVPALNNLAYLYADENRSLPQALMYASRAFAIAPQSESIQDTLGYVLLRNGRTDQALRMLQRAAAGNPDNPSILYHLALAYRASGDRAKATEALQKALSHGDFSEAKEAKTLLEKVGGNGKS